MKVYIQTVYIPRENILFLEEWLEHHSNLGIDEYYLYDNTGSIYKDYIGNYELNGMSRSGWDVKESTKDISDDDIKNIEDKLFSKYNVNRVKWQPKDHNGDITYGQVEAINHFSKQVKNGFCVFIDIDEFLIIDEYQNIKDYLIKNYDYKIDGIKIYQKKYLSRWYNKEFVKNIKAKLDIRTNRWAPKIIGNIERINNVSGSIHDFLSNVTIDENIYFNHYNHDEKVHDWLLNNNNWIDNTWIPITFNQMVIEHEKNKIK